MMPPATDRHERHGHPPLVFINYRGTDCHSEAVFLYTRLVDRLGRDAVFLDRESISAGQDYESILVDCARHSAVLLALIGRQWLARDDAGRFLLDNPDDWVRREILEARDHSVPVVPVLLDGATGLGSTRLPPSLEFLAGRQHHTIRDEYHLTDVTALVDRLERDIPRIRNLACRRRSLRSVYAPPPARAVLPGAAHRKRARGPVNPWCIDL